MPDTPSSYEALGSRAQCAFSAMAIGTGVLLVALIPAIATGGLSILLALAAIGRLGVFWNLMTAALLPAVCSTRDLSDRMAGREPASAPRTA